MNKVEQKERIYSLNEKEIIEGFNLAFKDVISLYLEQIDKFEKDQNIFKIFNYFHNLREKILDGTIVFEKEFSKNPFLETLINQKLLIKLKSISNNKDLDDLFEKNKNNMESQYDSFINKRFNIVKF